MLAKVKDLSVVRLKDGREGTVLEVLEAQGLPLSYMVEVDETPEGMMVTVPHDAVASVLWVPKE